ncbi:MAG: adenosylcobinamide-phosphate synthase CbiB [Anaerolineales bacterium]|nr:adenosylcobinamide-phosphate synthase CbiB [Anaerolineales bacterium]MCS7249157.1 adenosylcobinamide-phosphate synthase CbiB [Anaerolineales bacterium]MDW8162970.1 adenosylcobinamide-phosphate synthase CbiB [Anaerolineales bacterium]MDW8445883.1 adenosylcobinamide-phosphate synthase CbiB [Anaerolineales bacterium]
MKWKRVLILWLALGLDEWLGDPPNRWHPVAWLGSLIARVERWVRCAHPWRDFWAGLAVWLGGAALVGGGLRLLSVVLNQFPRPLAALGEAILLKLSLAQRGLRQAALAVEGALQRVDLAEARRQLAWHLVSRETGQLNEAQVVGATIESIAENTSDGILAPLLYYALGGLPLAWVYRFANTLDSMWGYRNARYEWLGKAAARLDDLLNWLPARMTALALVTAAALGGEDARRAMVILRRDARTTASPNAGYPMSAMAGALGVELEKVGHYRLGQGLTPPTARDIRRAVRLMHRAVLLGVALLGLVSLLCSAHKKPDR